MYLIVCVLSPCRAVLEVEAVSKIRWDWTICEHIHVHIYIYFLNIGYYVKHDTLWAVLLWETDC